MSTLKPGDRIERYVIEAILGEGGMGRVYRALDERLDRRVAVKVLLAGADDGTEGRARLLREARAAATLDHPNVVQVFDVGEADGSPFIAMELVVGRSLRAIIDERAAPVRERVRVLVEVARALAAAHDAGIVHRDVKPENVIVRADGRVKVLDFGIARRSRAPVDPSAPSDVHLATLTAEGVKMGTPMYMAPEQIRGAAIDGRTDQFAWGVTAYELFTGKLPWNGGDAMALMASILTEDPTPIGVDVPGEVANVVRRALFKRADDRFASMGEIVLAFDQYLGLGGPVGAGPRSPNGPPPGSGPSPSSPPRVPALSRRYSPKELEQILDRALSLQPGYRYEEIAAAAREVGVDERTLESAMTDLVKHGRVEPPEVDRLRSRNRFYRHAGVWGAFASFFFLINLSNVFRGHGGWWFEYPSISLGVFLAIHAVFHYFPAPKSPGRRAERSPDPVVEEDARAVSTLLAAKGPRVRIEPGTTGAKASARAAELAAAEAELEAELEQDGEARRRRVP